MNKKLSVQKVLQDEQLSVQKVLGRGKLSVRKLLLSVQKVLVSRKCFIGKEIGGNLVRKKNKKIGNL